MNRPENGRKSNGGKGLGETTKGSVGLTPPDRISSFNQAFWEGEKERSLQGRVLLEGLLGPCGNSSVGRAQPCQGWGRRFESGFPLWGGESVKSRPSPPLFWRRSQVVRQRSAKPPFGSSNLPGASGKRAVPSGAVLFLMPLGQMRTAGSSRAGLSVWVLPVGQARETSEDAVADPEKLNRSMSRHAILEMGLPAPAAPSARRL